MNVNGACVVCASGQQADPSSGQCVTVGASDGGTQAWQAGIAGAEALISNAKMMLILGGTIVSALFITGLAMMWNPFTMPIGIALMTLSFVLGVMFSMIVHSLASSLQQVANDLGAMGGLAQNYQGPLNQIAGSLSSAANMLLIPGAGGLIAVIKGMMINPTLPMNQTAGTQYNTEAPMDSSQDTSGNSLYNGSGGSFNNLGTQSGTGGGTGAGSGTGAGGAGGAQQVTP